MKPRENDPLTERQMEILDLVIQRLNYDQIGTRLFISPRTVQTHMFHIYIKMGITGERRGMRERLIDKVLSQTNP